MSNLPNLIIFGAAKAASSSLFTYLSESKDIFSSPIKELRYFNNLYYGRELPDVKEYQSHFEQSKDEKYRMEATPEYFHDGAVVAQALHHLLPSCKLILILRDPTDRFISYFNHLKKTLSLDVKTSLEDYFQYCRKHEGFNPQEDKDVNLKRGLHDGMYAASLREWETVHKGNIKIIFFDKLASNPKAEVESICRWLEIDASFLENMDFSVQNKSVIPKNRLLHKVVYSIFFKLEKFFRKHTWLKNSLRNIYYKLNTRGSDSDDLAKKKISEYYDESNHELKDFLEKNFDNLELPGWLTKYPK